MEINKAIEFLDQFPVIKNPSMTYWIQLGQAIEVIKQYVEENEKEKEISELSNLPKIKTEDNVTFTLMTAPHITTSINPVEKPIGILKAEPKVKHHGMVDSFTCGSCNNPIKLHQHFCEKCGYEINWRFYNPPGYRGSKSV